MVSLTCEVPPAEEVVPLAEVKAHLFVSDADSDSHIQRLIAAAAAACSAYCGRGFGVATYAYTLDEFPAGGNRIRLPVTPVVDGSVVVAYVDGDGAEQTIDAAGLYVGLRTGQVAPATCWPATRHNRPDAVTVTFDAGQASGVLPKQARQAILLAVADWWRNRGDEGERTIPPAARFLLDQLASGGLD